MKAKDTVIKLKCIVKTKTVYPANQIAEAQMIVDQKRVCDQAEISFKAGMKVVAEWIDRWWESGKGGKQNWYELEAKLKEWGIK